MHTRAVIERRTRCDNRCVRSEVHRLHGGSEIGFQGAFYRLCSICRGNQRLQCADPDVLYGSGRKSMRCKRDRADPQPRAPRGGPSEWSLDRVFHDASSTRAPGIGPRPIEQSIVGQRRVHTRTSGLSYKHCGHRLTAHRPAMQGAVISVDQDARCESGKRVECLTVARTTLDWTSRTLGMRNSFFSTTLLRESKSVP